MKHTPIFIAVLAFIIAVNGLADAQVPPQTQQPSQPLPKPEPTTTTNSELERALRAAVLDPPVALESLEAIERALAESRSFLASSRIDLALDVELAEAMAHQASGIEAARLADEAAALDRQTRQSQVEARQRAEERALRERERQRALSEEEAYLSGYESLSNGQWDRALALFNRVIETQGRYADRALYWKAYAQYKLGQGTEALQTIGDLQKNHPDSRYLSDARALEVEVRERAGQPADPDAEETEELKLLALSALQNTDPEQAVPMLEKLLRGSESPRLKQRALFVLAQSRSPQARQILVSVARGEHNPDLQLRALQYLGFTRSDENKTLLVEIYMSSKELDVKRRILRAYGTMKDQDRLLQAAQSESAPELRSEAVRQLGRLRAHDALASLYARESDIRVKQDILQAMHVSGNADLLLKLAQTETNPTLKRTAVRSLGMMPGEQTGAALKTIYEGDNDLEVRKAAIQGLFIQKNDVALVELARKESNPELKKEIVGRLSNMKSKVALDYLMELLNK